MDKKMRSKWLLFFLITCFLCTASLSSAEVETTVTTKNGRGYGSNYKEAVQNAVMEVIQQHSGVRIEATTAIKQEAVDQISNSNGRQENISTFNDQFAKHVKETTSGSVSNYRVVNHGQDGSGQHWAVVEVLFRKSKYITPGHSVEKRRKMAVSQFYIRDSLYEFGNNPIPGREVSRLLTQGTVSSITQSRKFVVLEREYQKEYRKEKDVLLSGNAPWKEKLKLGQMLGTDYLLFGVVEDLGIVDETHTIEITGQIESKNTAYMAVSYRVMAMATGQLKWSDEIRVEIDSAVRIGLQDLIDKISRRIALDLLENIYPPTIVHIEDDRVLLNIGAKSYEAGTRLQVLKKGERLVDPYTQEFMGYSEVPVGVVEIIRSTPKVTYARIVESTDEVSKGMICRRAVEYKTGKEKFDDSKRKATNARMTNGGGVKLPFD